MLSDTIEELFNNDDRYLKESAELLSDDLMEYAESVTASGKVVMRAMIEATCCTVRKYGITDDESFYDYCHLIEPYESKILKTLDEIEEAIKDEIGSDS